MSQNIFSIFPQKIFYIKRNDNKWTISLLLGITQMLIQHGHHNRMIPLTMPTQLHVSMNYWPDVVDVVT
jgi:hypothetical protein